MKKITLFMMALLVSVASMAEIVVEKVWENSTDAPTNAKNLGGHDGVLYCKDYSTGVIYAYSAEGRTILVDEGAASDYGFMTDDAGNIIHKTGGLGNTNPSTMNLYLKGSTVAIPISFEGIGGRADFPTAVGDFSSAEGGRVYFYPAGLKTVKYVEIKNANADTKTADVTVGELGAVSVAGTSTSAVYPMANGEVGFVRSTGLQSINGSVVPTLPSHAVATMGAAAMYIKNAAGETQEVWAYPTKGTANYTATFNVYNTTAKANVTAAEGTKYYLADSVLVSGQSLFMSRQKIDDYSYYLYIIAGYKATACYKVYETEAPTSGAITEVTTMAELKANEGKRVLYKGLEPAVVEFDGFWGTEYEYYMPDSTTAFNYSGYVIPAKMDVYGTYNSAYVADEWSEATPTFVIDSVAVIYAFNNMGDLVNFVENEATEAQKAASYEVKKPAVVTLSSMFSFYVQYEAQSRWGGSSWEGLMVQVGRMSMFQTKAGDALQLKGAYVPATYDENDVMQQPAYFALETGTVVSENNKLNYASINLSETGLKYASEYYASFGRLSKGGKIIEHNYAYYYVVSYVDYVQNGNMYDEVSVTDSLQLMVAGPVDLDSYIGKELDKFIVGVLDYDAYSAAPIFYVTELQESKLYYDNIAELLAAGAQTDYSMSSVLRNPVLLTYISYNQWAGYTIFVQDETGAIALKGLGVAKEDGDGYDFPYTVVAGDSIKGVEGFTTFGEVAAFMWSGDEYVSGLKLEKVSDGVVTPIDITLAEFNADVALVQDAMMMGDFYLSKYANKVVRVKDLAREDDPEDEKWPYLVQGEEKIKVSTYYWGDIAVPYSIKSLTGIADYTVINGQTASIQPLNAASVEVAGGVNVELVTLTDIYTENGLIVVDGEFQIFTTTGQNVTDMNGNLQSGVYVVRTATAVGKVVVK